MKPLRIVFAGTPAFGLPCLEALHQSAHELIAVYTQPDRPAGRGRSLQPSAIKAWALEQGLPIYQPQNFKEDDALATLTALAPDLLVVIAYGLILPKSVLEIPRLGCLNVHASLLPRWRGASPIQHSILHNDALTGLTLMQMDVGMDTGPILCQKEVNIDPEETAGSLQDKLSALAPAPLLETIEALAYGKANPVKQESIDATYAGKIQKEDAKIDWQLDAAAIARRVRAFHPWPIAFTTIGETVLRIHKVELTDITSTSAPGTILRLDKQGLLVATGDMALRVISLQFPGSRALLVSEWLHGGKTDLQVGSVLT